MAWAASRTTARLEDEAYYLLGIFQVNMSMRYGEGKKAFRRLQEEIIKESDDHTLLAWHDERDIKPVLAPSVSCFRNLHDLTCVYATNDSRFGHTLSNSGLNIKLMLIPWAMNIYVAPLSCGQVLTKPHNSPSESPIRGHSRMAIFLRRTKFEDHLIRVSVDGRDFVMLNSDIVACKRDSFAIKDRQVFVRQSLVDLSDDICHSFSFNYLHPHMFSGGSVPTPGGELLNFYDRRLADYSQVDDIQEPYSHYESVAFDISNLSAGKRPLYLHLGFDLEFAPVCLVTTEPRLTDNKDRICEHDFEEMYSLQSKQISSLHWLLAQVEAGKTSTSVLAFKATRGASTEVRCKGLSLKIKFDVISTAYKSNPNSVAATKMWLVTFEHFETIPTEPPTPHKPIMPLQVLDPDKLTESLIEPRTKRKGTGSKFPKFWRVRSPESVVSPRINDQMSAVDPVSDTHFPDVVTEVEFPSNRTQLGMIKCMFPKISARVDAARLLLSRNDIGGNVPWTTTTSIDNKAASTPSNDLDTLSPQYIVVTEVPGMTPVPPKREYGPPYVRAPGTGTLQQPPRKSIKTSHVTVATVSASSQSDSDAYPFKLPTAENESDLTQSDTVLDVSEFRYIVDAG